MVQVHRLGCTSLTASEQNDEPFCIYIVFIHGLRGHPRKTWEAGAVDDAPSGGSDAVKKRRGLKTWLTRPRQTSATRAEQIQDPSDSSSSLASSPLPQTVFWPEDYLAQDIPQARVWTYGYMADVIGGLFQANDKNSVSKHGQDLSVALERDINNGKPLVFVVHSLGGIIVKDAIRRSTLVRKHTKLIIFLGTPHRGSGYAGWGQIASNLARLAFEVLDNIHEEFKTIAHDGAIQLHSFQESRGISGMKGLDEKVVDDFSSKLDLPRALETVESIDGNHMQIARYTSRDDQGYRYISKILKTLVEQQELARRQLSPATVADIANVTSSEALSVGESLTQQRYLISRNGRYLLSLQGDGNLTLRGPNGILGLQTPMTSKMWTVLLWSLKAA